MKWTTNYAAGGVCVIGCSGTTGSAVNQLRGPRDLKFDRHGNIYVTDQANQRIQKFTIQVPTGGCPSRCIFQFLILSVCFVFFRWLDNNDDEILHKHL